MATVHATGHMSSLCCWAGLVGLFTDDQAALLWRCFPGGIDHIEDDSKVFPAAAHAPGQIIRKANPAMAGRCHCKASYISAVPQAMLFAYSGARRSHGSPVKHQRQSSPYHALQHLIQPRAANSMQRRHKQLRMSDVPGVILMQRRAGA